MRRLAATIAIAVLASFLFVGPAEAAGDALLPSDSRPGVGSYLSFNLGTFQTQPIRCARIQFSNSPYGVGGRPTGLALFTNTAISTSGYFQGGWTSDNSARSIGVVAFTHATGQTPTSGQNYFGFDIQSQPSAPAGQTVYVSFATYTGPSDGSGNCTGGFVDSPRSFAYATSPSATVSAVVDPTFAFSVGTWGSSCNGVALSAGASSTGTSIDLGRINAGSAAVGAQQLSVSGNMAGGFTVGIRGTSLAGSRSFAEVAGTNASPVTFPTAGTEAFGYTTSDSTLSGAAARFSGSKFSALTSSGEVLSSAGMAESACVGYQATAASTTPSGSYAATVIYTAVPTF